MIRRRAAKARLSMSEFLRRQAAGAETASAKPRKVRCRHTGAKIFGPLPQSPPLTTEEVRGMLADFP